MPRSSALKIAGAAVIVALAATAAPAQDPLGDAAEGRALAEAVCAPCHGVKPGDRKSLLKSIASFQAIAEKSDRSEMALRVFLRSSHPRMPNYILTNDEVDDLVAYIETLRPD